MNTSTVDGTTASPRAASSGVVTSVGCVAKLVPNCTPPKRTERPQAPGALIPSPTRSVASRSGMSWVQVVSRRVVPRRSSSSRASIVFVTTPGCAEEPELEQRAALVAAGDLLGRQVVVQERARRDRRGPEACIVGTAVTVGTKASAGRVRSTLCVAPSKRRLRPSPHRSGNRPRRRRARSPPVVASAAAPRSPRHAANSAPAASRRTSRVAPVSCPLMRSSTIFLAGAGRRCIAARRRPWGREHRQQGEERHARASLTRRWCRVRSRIRRRRS